MKQQILDLNNQNRIRLRIIRLQSQLKDKENWKVYHVTVLKLTIDHFHFSRLFRKTMRHNNTLYII